MEPVWWQQHLVAASGCTLTTLAHKNPPHIRQRACKQVVGHIQARELWELRERLWQRAVNEVVGKVGVQQVGITVKLLGQRAVEAAGQMVGWVVKGWEGRH